MPPWCQFLDTSKALESKVEGSMWVSPVALSLLGRIARLLRCDANDACPGGLARPVRCVACSVFSALYVFAALHAATLLFPRCTAGFWTKHHVLPGVLCLGSNRGCWI